MSVTVQAPSTILTTFIGVANKEYNALSEYCNSLSHLSHAIRRRESHNHNHNHKPSSIMGIESLENKEQQQEEALLEYMQALNTLQTHHSQLIHCKNSYMKEEEDNSNSIKNYNNNHHGKVQGQLESLMSQHIALSGRVLRTCASSDTKGYGPLYENGILKNLTGGGDVDWHEARLVSLVALRASIERLKTFLEVELKTFET